MITMISKVIHLQESTLFDYILGSVREMSIDIEQTFYQICKSANKADWYVLGADIALLGEDKNLLVETLVAQGLIEETEYLGQHYLKCRITEKGQKLFQSREEERQ